MKALAAAVAGVLFATPPAAQVLIERYTCERSVEIPVLYLSGDSAAAVVIIEGEPVYLEAARSASGARYAAAPDQSAYIWWTKLNTASLLWRDAATGTETHVYKNCVVQPAAPR